MKNTFLVKLNNYNSTPSVEISIIRTRQALISLDDLTLNSIGYMRQQIQNGDFFNVTDLVNFPTGKSGVERTIEEKKAA